MRSPQERLAIIRHKIELINQLVDGRGGKISAVLADEVRDRPAVLMHLASIAEQFKKLKEENAHEVLERFSKEDLKGVGDVRNFIAHDYEGVDMAIIETAIRYGLPSLQKSLGKGDD